MAGSETPAETRPPAGRSDAVRAAWVGAVAGTAAAAIVSAVVSLWGVYAEDRRATTSLLREQQVTIYADMSANYQQFAQEYTEYEAVVRGEVPRDGNDGRGRWESLFKAERALFATRLRVMLVASPETAERVDKLSDGVSEAVERAGDINQVPSMGEYGGRGLQNTGAFIEFTESARDDLVGFQNPAMASDLRFRPLSRTR
jgi:hypothetical protein